MQTRLLPVKHQQQTTNANCLPTCCQMVLAYHGYAISQKRLHKLLEITPMGVPYSRIKRLTQLSMDVQLNQGDEAIVRNAIDNELPLILFIQTGELSYWQENAQHAMVVIGYDNHNFYVNDPILAQGDLAIPIDELMLAWLEYDFTYAVISPNN